MNEKICYSCKRDEGFIENNDCTVIALMNATGWSYTECHAITKRAGRRDKNGFNVHKILRQCKNEKEDFNFSEIYVWDFIPNKYDPTLAQVMNHERFKNGTFILTNCNHAFVLKNGIIYDNHQKLHSRRRIKTIHEIL